MKAFPLNLVDYAYNAQDVMHFLAGRRSGVFELEDNLKVEKTSGLGLQVKTGKGWLAYKIDYGLSFWLDEPQEITLELGDEVYKRIDRVVVSWDTAGQSLMPEIKVLKGTPAETPTAPSITQNADLIQICLAEIELPIACSDLASVDIKDTRPDDTLCGLVNDNYIIHELETKIEGELSALTTQVNQNKSNLANLESANNRDHSTFTEWYTKLTALPIFYTHFLDLNYSSDKKDYYLDWYDTMTDGTTHLFIFNIANFNTEEFSVTINKGSNSVVSDSRSASFTLHTPKTFKTSGIYYSLINCDLSSATSNSFDNSDDNVTVSQDTFFTNSFPLGGGLKSYKRFSSESIIGSCTLKAQMEIKRTDSGGDRNSHTEHFQGFGNLLLIFVIYVLITI